MSKFKVWIEVEEHTPDGDEEYTRHGEPLDLACATEEAALKLQSLLHDIGGTIQGPNA